MEINIDRPLESFKKHLNLKDNQRVILSGKFGIGKTYFVNKFFDAHRKDYETFYIHPINYSVSQNQDIFELIKYDILFELFSKDVEFDKLNIPHIDTFINYSKKNGHHILAPFIQLLPVLGKSIYSIIENLKGISDDYLKEHEDMQVDDKKAAIEYLEGFTLKEGCIYEEDFFTQLIKQLLSQFSASDVEDKKETVLIIDDLDRIDPEHIFRIFNVLGVHSDIDGKNKFRFDKVILICDIENIRQIFQNRYGLDVDFTGYIDKFYSKSIYAFDNSGAVNQEVYNILSSIVVSDKNSFLDFKVRNSLITKNVAFILTSMVMVNSVTPRILKRITGNNYENEEYKLYLRISREVRNHYVGFVNIVEFLIWVFGGINELIDAVSKCRDFEFNEHSAFDIEYFCYQTISILDYENHQFVKSKEARNFVDKNGKIIPYVANEESFLTDKLFFAYPKDDSFNNEEHNNVINSLSYFDLLLQALEKFRDQRILKPS